MPGSGKDATGPGGGGLRLLLRRFRGEPREQLVVFTRCPEPGRTKTRLIPVVGREGAAELQRRMTEHTMHTAGTLAGRRPLSLEVRFEGGSERLIRRWLGPDSAYAEQGGRDLGEKMRRAFDDAFARSMTRVVVVGCDCPGVTARLLESAFDALRERDVVLGPASDGGYYLIGLRAPEPRVFQDIPWGTAEALARTLEAAQAAALSVCRLETLDDVDRPEDLPVWQRVAASWEEPSGAPRVTVIIPTLNEAANVGFAVATAARGRDTEVIVVDGGSDDGTADIARSCGAAVMTARRGRATQMNAGAAAAGGELLVFLHADTQLPWGFDDCVREALATPSVSAGAFGFRVEGGGAALRMVERLVSCRARRWQMPYGDQALFVRAETFRAVGGYPEMPIMEDYELVRRLRRLGRVVVVHSAALTSARRWARLGPVNAALTNQLAVLAYRSGMSPERILRWYRRARG